MQSQAYIHSHLELILSLLLLTLSFDIPSGSIHHTVALLGLILRLKPVNAVIVLQDIHRGAMLPYVLNVLPVNIVIVTMHLLFVVVDVLLGNMAMQLIEVVVYVLGELIPYMGVRCVLIALLGDMLPLKPVRVQLVPVASFRIQVPPSVTSAKRGLMRVVLLMESALNAVLEGYYAPLNAILVK